MFVNDLICYFLNLLLCWMRSEKAGTVTHNDRFCRLIRGLLLLDFEKLDIGVG